MQGLILWLAAELGIILHHGFQPFFPPPPGLTVTRFYGDSKPDLVADQEQYA